MTFTDQFIAQAEKLELPWATPVIINLIANILNQDSDSIPDDSAMRALIRSFLINYSDYEKNWNQKVGLIG